MDFAKNLLFILCLCASCVHHPEPLKLEPTQDFISSRKLPAALPKPKPSFEQLAREWMDKHTGIVETPPNSNRGELIDFWNKQAKVPVGSFWCGSAAGAFVIAMGGNPPKGYAWTPNWAVKSRRLKEPKIGSIGTFYFASKKRIAHVGVVYEPLGLSVIMWEGNGNEKGSRNGDRTLKKKRPKNVIEGFYNWVD